MTAPSTPDQLIAYVHQEQVLIRRRSGALFEHDVLLVLSELVLTDASILPEFQAIANVVMAKALIDGRLPKKRPGAKKGAAVKYDPQVLTEQYFDLLDKGMPAHDCADEIAEKYDLGEKRIKQIVKENSWLFGESKAHREQFRRDPVYRDEVEPDDRNIALAGLEKEAALRKLNAILTGA